MTLSLQCDEQAAIDEPALYSSWGKNLSTVLAFHAFAPNPRVEDVTASYVRPADLPAALERRSAEVPVQTFAALLDLANAELREMAEQIKAQN